MLPILKEKLLAKGAVVNCDETWCRVKVNRKYGKKYIWCMVNKEAKIAVYFYDDGMRGKIMQDALDYLNRFWGQLIRYLKDGRYNIDRSTFGRSYLCSRL
ncbi:MAG: transposase [Prevotella sp.]|nr:transposase [Prevotella sp.]